MKSVALQFAFAACLLGIQSAHANSLLINPTSDGSLYTCAGCNVVSDGAYVLASGYIQGAVKFSSAGINGTVTQAVLSLNPYGLPLWGQQVSLYGYGTSIAQLDVSDANAGTLIGVFTLPAALGYGQDAFFDVTSFVSNTAAPYLAFNIRTTDTDVFSSLEYNYGHPSQLNITTSVPELPALPMLAAGLLGTIAVFRSRRAAYLER